MLKNNNHFQQQTLEFCFIFVPIEWYNLIKMFGENLIQSHFFSFRTLNAHVRSIFAFIFCCTKSVVRAWNKYSLIHLDSTCEESVTDTHSLGVIWYTADLTYRLTTLEGKIFNSLKLQILLKNAFEKHTKRFVTKVWPIICSCDAGSQVIKCGHLEVMVRVSNFKWNTHRKHT